MRIEILGMGCPKCRKLATNAEEAVRQVGIEAEVTKITDVTEISKYGVLFTPALVIDGEVKAAGKILSPAQIAELIRAVQS
ncbi:MAG: thioredoxin family protein [Armatimonadota bacterium]